MVYQFSELFYLYCRKEPLVYHLQMCFKGSDVWRTEFEGWLIENERKDMTWCCITCSKTFPHHAHEIWQLNFSKALSSFLFIYLKNKNKTQKREIDCESSQYVPHVLLNKLFRVMICGFFGCHHKAGLKIQFLYSIPILSGIQWEAAWWKC